MDITNIIQILTPGIVPIIIAAEAKWTARIPSSYKPYAALLFGQLSELANAYFTGHTFSPEIGLVLGAAAIGAREVVVQTKSLLAGAPAVSDITSMPPKPPAT